jgi:hypothetical protein
MANAAHSMLLAAHRYFVIEMTPASSVLLQNLMSWGQLASGDDHVKLTWFLHTVTTVTALDSETKDVLP